MDMNPCFLVGNEGSAGPYIYPLKEIILGYLIPSFPTKNQPDEGQRNNGCFRKDWALLSLRFELHLLAHAFLHDCGDPERLV